MDASENTQAGGTDDPGTNRRAAKRHRIMIACTCCRQRKSRCDGVRPKCSACASHNYECTYANTTTLTKNSASTKYIEGLESRLTVLERSLAEVSGKVSRIESLSADDSLPQQQSPETIHITDLQDEDGITVESHDPTDGIGSISFTKEEESGYFGPSSNIAFTRQIVRSTTEVLKSISSTASPVSPSAAALQSHVLHVSRPTSPPSRNFGTQSNLVPAGTEPFVLPPENETMQMIETYFSTTVQLLLLMSQYLQGSERSIETWNIHGLAVKAAYQLGLHSSDAMQNHSAVEAEIRKRTWFGCVILDRTLSMTMGRPTSIPDSFVKLSLPCSLRSICPSSTILGQNENDDDSTVFYSATITLYKILGEVIEVLYENNLGCEASVNLFGIASSLLQFEQKYIGWQHSLPASFSLIVPGAQLFDGRGELNLRFRLILTLRFLNVRILTHRPMLSKYLELIANPHSDMQQMAILKQIGANSMRICINSAVDVIKLVREVLAPQEPRSHLLGAWWFSLYYTFNASLVIYSALLIIHQMQARQLSLDLDDTGISMDSLNKAIECLSLVDKGSRMTEKCVRYITALAKTLSTIYVPDRALEVDSDNLATNPSTAFSTRQAPINFAPHEISDFYDSTDLHIGMTLDDLIYTSEFNLMPTN
ncbi:hypothetical protein AA0119_g11409 [Alternaria tenuissima]|uniref:Zn(2)-C6 fungal-type domain-containing protein n=1 Tax=Alternaria tenuissima TaxID=119927 RepID=A0ABY0FU41_9PLEO|nr:hypothetical protein AA0119_g11409 [Alternaria tenuissima]